jgi:hypothetical protein
VTVHVAVLVAALALASSSGATAQARLESEIASRVNAVRKERGLAPLRSNPGLAALGPGAQPEHGSRGFLRARGSRR